MEKKVACRFIDRCLECIREGCIWLQETLMPCRQNLHDVEIKPAGVIYNQTGCKGTNGSEEEKVYPHAAVGLRRESFGLHWIWAMVLCICVALVIAVWSKLRHSYRTPVQTLMNAFQRR